MAKRLTWGQARAKGLATDRDMAEHRANDPYEQCKMFLGRKGYVCFDRRLVYGPYYDGFQVGKMVVPTKADLIAYAQSLGWKSSEASPL